MKIINLCLDNHLLNVIEYLKDKYCTSAERLIVEAITEYYSEEIEELERK